MLGWGRFCVWIILLLGLIFNSLLSGNSIERKRIKFQYAFNRSHKRLVTLLFRQPKEKKNSFTNSYSSFDVYLIITHSSCSIYFSSCILHRVFLFMYYSYLSIHNSCKNSRQSFQNQEHERMWKVTKSSNTSYMMIMIILCWVAFFESNYINYCFLPSYCSFR